VEGPGFNKDFFSYLLKTHTDVFYEQSIMLRIVLTTPTTCQVPCIHFRMRS
jgi:hypothetical protein